MLDNLLTWARSQQDKIPFNPVESSLYSLAHDACIHLNHAARKKKIEVQLDIAPEISIQADSEMIKTVIRNLVSNAIKYTSTEGTINVSGKQIEPNVEIEISDNRTGMSEQTMQSLFKVGETNSQKGTNGESGTGFGLLLCKEFIDKHNGTIRVESELNKGSRFVITLPLKIQ